MEPGYFVLLVFMLIEAFLVTLLVLPMPSNAVRGALTKFVANLYRLPAFRYVAYAILCFDVVYFWFVFDALMHPLYDFGLLTSPFDASCEMRATNYVRERNAYITSFSLFLALVLNRLIDIQSKLHEARGDAKMAQHGYVPMGSPVQGSGSSSKRFKDGHFD